MNEVYDADIINLASSNIKNVSPYDNAYPIAPLSNGLFSPKCQRHFFLKFKKVFAFPRDFSSKNPFAIFEILWYNTLSA